MRGSAAVPGTLENTVTVSTTTPESDSSNNAARRTVNVVPAPVPVPAPGPGGELTVTKTVDRSIAYVGEPVTYTLRVRNTGAGPTGPVLVADLFSAPVEIIDVEVDSGLRDDSADRLQRRSARPRRSSHRPDHRDPARGGEPAQRGRGQRER